MKKTNFVALVLALGLLATNIFVPIAHAEGTATEDSEQSGVIAEESASDAASDASLIDDVTEPDDAEVVEQSEEGPEEEVEEGSEEASEEVEGHAAAPTDADSDTNQPTFPLPSCEAVLKSFDGAIIKYGNIDSSDDVATEVIEDAISSALDNDLVCLAEFSAAQPENGYLRMFPAKYSSEADKYILFAYSRTWNEGEAEYQYYRSEPITINLVKDTSTENATIADAFLADFAETFAGESIILTGDEIKTFTSDGFKNFQPTKYQALRGLLEKYPTVSLQSPAEFNTTFYDEEDDDVYNNTVCYFMNVYVGDYYYGYVHLHVGYAAQAVESQGDEPVTAFVAEADNLPSDLTFIADRQEDTSVIATKVLREGEKLVIVYDLSMESVSQGDITQFPHGVVVEMIIDGQFIDPSMPVYARYINENGEIVEADIPVTLECFNDNLSSPISLSAAAASSSNYYCYAYFTAQHFSLYALVNTNDPFTPATPPANFPATGAATTSDQNGSAVSASPLFAALIAVLAAAILAVKAKKSTR